VVVYQKEDMMRIEMRFLKGVKGNIARMLKSENEASVLYDDEFFRRAMKYYMDEIVKKMCKDSSNGLQKIIKQLEEYEAAIATSNETHDTYSIINSRQAA